MAQQFEEYLAVLKASYDYTPRSDEDEIAITENQILFLIERVDEDWWKVKVKGDSQDEDSPMGLVPAAYVEPADHTSVVKALYDYDAAANGELTMKEDEILYVYSSEGDWLLVQSQKEGGKAGYVPGNYVEVVSEEEAIEPAVVAAPVPPSTSRPVSTYVDPADRVALAKVTADDIKTWSVSEIDKKGKKKKGTLGIGNGAVFFASEADKTPVQQWKTTDIQSAIIEKSKHVHIDIGGGNPINLHFHAGSKDNAEAILAKLESSKEIHSAAQSSTLQADTPASQEEEEPARPSALRSSEPKGKKNGTSVHFSPASPTIIPPREPSDDEEEAEPQPPSPTTDGRYDAPPTNAVDQGQEDDWAIALYDFTADGDDELTVKEGERLIILERDGSDWWKCRNAKGTEGVVPASYLEPESGAAPSAVDDHEEEEARAEREAEERAEAERQERLERERKEKERQEKLEKEKAEKERAEQERRKAEAQQRAKAAAEAAEQERKKRKEAAATRAVSPPAEPAPRESSSRSRDSKRTETPPSTPNRPSSDRDKPNFPPADKTRIWHDRTGQFRVEAAFLGFNEGKLRLHKINGVVVEVPAEKMSHDDLRYVEKLTKRSKSSSSAPRISEDDIPLALQRPNGSSSSGSRPSETRQPKKAKIDWFDFFLSAGCDVDDCTRYTSAFERDKIDENILPDITEGTMRSLGLREGDIIRVKKAIEKRSPHKTIGTPADQMRSDEELARRLQAEENAGGSAKSPPNLFASPGGALKTRRGRPQPSKSLPPSVDLNTISTVSDQIQRTSSPQLLSPAGSSASVGVQPPPRSSSALATKSSGFDDDAWTNRPSSTRPIAPTPPVAPTVRTPSAPPAQATMPVQAAAPPVPVTAPPAPTPPPAAAPPSTQPASTAAPAKEISLAKTTEADIFDQLARLSELRKNQPVASPSPPVISPQNITPAPSITPAQSAVPTALMPQLTVGIGLGPSPSPMSHPFQPTGLMQPTLPPGPRGPLAPVPANQGLLQPLIPTQTGLNNFVPTRANTNPSPFQTQPQQQPSFLSTQPPSFLNSQPTLNPQPTGFPGMLPISSQPSGMPLGGFGQTQASPFQNSGFDQIQPNPTGFNPNFGQLPIQQSPPPLPNSNTNNTSPANIFAQMKLGTFATENDSNPQPADRYNALRTNPITVQPTGWGGFQTYNGFHQ